jgi:hypothetical protein
MARTIGVKYKNLIKRLIKAETEKGLINLSSSVQAVKDQLPDEIYDTWESAHAEIEMLVSDGIYEAFHNRSVI